MTSILGISSHYHDSAAAILVDGKLIAAAQEERFSRIKHDSGIPQKSIDYCLREAGLQASQIDYVAYYEKPIAKFERLLETYLAFAPNGYRFFRESVPSWTQRKLFLQRAIRSALSRDYRKRIVFVEHHLSHAGTAFYNSPFEESAILTVDGVGEWTTTASGVGNGNQIQLDHELQFPHSLGLLYSAFTAYLGFHVNDGEYKVMGLAAYGIPEYELTILEQVIDLRSDGSFRLRMEYFDFCCGTSMTTGAFDRLFGGPPRLVNESITQRHNNIAASIQSAIEEILLRIANAVHERTGRKNLVMAGGVALNCVANSRIARESSFERVWVHGASGDAGGSIGAAQFVWYQLLGQPRSPLGNECSASLMLGPSYDDEAIVTAILESGLPYEAFDSSSEMCDEVAKQIEQQKVIGWFQGQMEFGPRALGARSILADARNPAMKEIVNTKIKRRESFRPFAPSVLSEFADQHFDIPKNVDCSTMTFVAGSKMGLVGSFQQVSVPSVVHRDGTARIQTVSRSTNPLFHQLLTVFHDRTGCPMLINTSFNICDEPIVCSPQDALNSMRSANLDALAIGRYIVMRDELERPTKTELANSTAPNISRFWEVVSLAKHRMRWVMQIASLPVRAISEVAMFAAYFGAIVPVGWIRKKLGKPRLEQDLNPFAKTYWNPRQNRREMQSHFRQS